MRKIGTLSTLLACGAASVVAIAPVSAEPAYHDNCSTYQFRVEFEESINYWRSSNGLPELTSAALPEGAEFSVALNNVVYAELGNSPQDVAWSLMSESGPLNSPDAVGFDVTVNDFNDGEYRVSGYVWAEGLDYETDIRPGPAAKIADNPVAYEAEFTYNTVCTGTLTYGEPNGSGDGNPEGYPTWPSGHDVAPPPTTTTTSTTASGGNDGTNAGSAGGTSDGSTGADGGSAGGSSGGSTTTTAGVLRPSAPFSAAVDVDANAARVWRLYTTYFLRQPDSGGFEYWRGTMTGGVDLGTVSDSFVLSEEFQLRYGTLSNAEFVERVYENVLKRGSDATGRQYWNGLLDSDRITRGNMMLYFSESAEYLLTTGTGYGLFG